MVYVRNTNKRDLVARWARRTKNDDGDEAPNQPDRLMERSHMYDDMR